MREFKATEIPVDRIQQKTVLTKIFTNWNHSFEVNEMSKRCFEILQLSRKCWALWMNLPAKPTGILPAEKIILQCIPALSKEWILAVSWHGSLQTSSSVKSKLPPPLSLTHSQLVYRSTSHKQHLGQIKYLHSSTELGCGWTGVWLNWGVGARGNGSGGGRLPFIFSPTPSCFSSVQLYIIKMAIIPPEVC